MGLVVKIGAWLTQVTHHPTFSFAREREIHLSIETHPKGASPTGNLGGVGTLGAPGSTGGATWSRGCPTRTRCEGGACKEATVSVSCIPLTHTNKC